MVTAHIHKGVILAKPLEKQRLVKSGRVWGKAIAAKVS